MSVNNIDGLLLMRKPFSENHISKLPKPTKRQTDEVKADYRKGIRCELCGQWHHPDVVHLDYVGHAALTNRLLDVDPEWNWEPLTTTDSGLPCFDDIGGLWIKLTVLGITRLGYGSADGKKGGDAIKEVIGDALRNAAMRFGAALDLWHKGDLHAGDIGSEDDPETTRKPPLDRAKVSTPAGIKYLLGFKSAGDAIQRISTSYEVSDEDAAWITEIWENCDR